MLIGVPKEIKPDEFRVGLTPAAVGEFVAHGHKVVVETGAGAGIAAGDDAYRAAGAAIAATAREVFAADMVVKVKEPQPSEWTQLRPGQILFTYLHLAADAPQALGLMASGVTAIAYETVTDARGHLPLLAPMSEVAGRLSIQAAAHRAGEAARRPWRASRRRARRAAAARWSSSAAASSAPRRRAMAVGLGAQVTVLDRSLPRLADLDDLFAGRVVTRFSTRDALPRKSPRPTRSSAPCWCPAPPRRSWSRASSSPP